MYFTGKSVTSQTGRKKIWEGKIMLGFHKYGWVLIISFYLHSSCKNPFSTFILLILHAFYFKSWTKSGLI